MKYKYCILFLLLSGCNGASYLSNSSVNYPISNTENAVKTSMKKLNTTLKEEKRTELGTILEFKKSPVSWMGSIGYIVKFRIYSDYKDSLSNFDISMSGIGSNSIIQVINKGINQQLEFEKTGILLESMKEKEIRVLNIRSILFPGLANYYVYKNNPYYAYGDAKYLSNFIIGTFFSLDIIASGLTVYGIYSHKRDEISVGLAYIIFLRLTSLLLGVEVKEYNELCKSGYNFNK
jgi:hypothetical protein